MIRKLVLKSIWVLSSGGEKWRACRGELTSTKGQGPAHAARADAPAGVNGACPGAKRGVTNPGLWVRRQAGSFRGGKCRWGCADPRWWQWESARPRIVGEEGLWSFQPDLDSGCPEIDERQKIEFNGHMDWTPHRRDSKDVRPQEAYRSWEERGLQIQRGGL